MVKKKSYTLTETAEWDFREARQWSRARWGEKQTKAYFFDLHNSAEYIAHHQASIAERASLVANTGLGLYPVKEHYLVYTPVNDSHIIIVALIRQVRDVPAILLANQFRIKREVKALQASLDTFCCKS